MKATNPIYLDYNATTPIDPRVAEAMLPFIHQHFGNPSSSHIFGVTAKKAVEKARRQVAEMLHCRIHEVVFTSGGSESNNYAVKGVAHAYRHKGNHIITSSIEHPAITEVCRFLEKQGYLVTYLPVDEYGLIDPLQVEEAITPQTILITIMHANNEAGTIEPIAEIAEIAHRHGVLVHTDCAQSTGKIPVHVDELQADLISLAGHKLYAPKGIGALYIRTGVTLEKLIHGAHHEMDYRAGTENVIEIAGLGKACELAGQDLSAARLHLQEMRDRLEKSLKERFPDIRIHGHPERRLPNTSSLGFRSMEANTILSELKGVAASAGAACHSDQVKISHVLEAMHVPREYAMGTIRFSVGRFTTASEIDQAVHEIIQVVERMRPSPEPDSRKADSKGVRLTRFTHGLGCACKLRPQLLARLLANMPPPQGDNILVSTDTADDAAVYRLDDHTALVQTVDFFTPVVDDPFQFGAIAAANSLSDIYAMGARPLFALNVVGFPSHRLPIEVLEAILEGAQSKAREAGISIIGGHTVDDTEPKFGLAVTGVVNPANMVTNCQAQPGDLLILTKPIGTGILSTALKRDLLEEEHLRLLVETMAALNRSAAEAMQSVGVNACTDVTGFGLLGHLLAMMKGSHTSAVIEAERVPFLPGALEYAASGVIPGGTRNNLDYTAPEVHYDEKVPAVTRLLLNDAQTSGGLLISVSEGRAKALMELMRERDLEESSVIGRIVTDSQRKITVGVRS